jgi:hypothetical protein
MDGKYKIYELGCYETGDVYYGKTTQTLEERLREHKKNLTYSSKQIILRDNYYIKQIDSIDDEKESIILERFYIENFQCVNNNIPGRSKKEYKKVNRDKILKQAKIYYEKNKDKIIEQTKIYHEKNKDKIYEKRKNNKYSCECGSNIRKDGKGSHEKTKKHLDFLKK